MDSEKQRPPDDMPHRRGSAQPTPPNQTSAGTGEACPPAPDIWAAARGEPDPVTTLRLDKHAQQCESCGEAWRLGKFLAVQLVSQQFDRETTAAASFRRIWIALVALLVFAAFAFLLLWLALPK